MILDGSGEAMEYAVEVPRMLLDASEPEIWLGISKVGGGTLGKAYSGYWGYVANVDGESLIVGWDLRTGTAKTHEQVARIIAGFLSDMCDDDSFDSAQRVFLDASADRLSDFA